MNILIISHGNIIDSSGAGKVHYELMNEYKRAGHNVDKIDLSDLYPKGQSKLSKIFGPVIQKKIFNYLKKNAYKYDVIDANIENVIYPKEAFGFKGLLFARSHGMRPLMMKAQRITNIVNSLKEERAERTFKAHVGAIIRFFYRKVPFEGFYLSLKHADLIHCLNETEYNFVRSSGISKNKIVFIPNGLSNVTLHRLELAGRNRANNSKAVSFVSAWRIMKGVKDWREISKSLIQIKNFDKILLIGTSWPEKLVKRDFDEDILPFIKIVSNYVPSQLPILLRDVKVGVFTSYSEGFCFAVLEQLASGIPVVAYDVHGVSDILRLVDTNLLIEPGNIKLLVEKVNLLFEMNDQEYENLSKKCIEISKKYVLENLALLYLQIFESFIHEQNSLNSKLSMDLFNSGDQRTRLTSVSSQLKI
jgi:glycosyltransferase involved in cell wall biosynthesis